MFSIQVHSTCISQTSDCCPLRQCAHIPTCNNSPLCKSSAANGVWMNSCIISNTTHTQCDTLYKDLLVHKLACTPRAVDSKQKQSALLCQA